MSASTGSRYGVARKPVPRWVSGLADQLDEPVGDRPAAASGGTRSKASARTWLAWVSGVSRPSASRYSACQAARACSLQLGVPDGVVGSAEHLGDRGPAGRALWAKYAVATSPLSAATKAAEVVDLLAGLEPLAPVEAGVPRGTARAAPARDGAPPGRGAAASRAIRSARSSQRTIVGHSSSSTCDVAVGAVELPRHDDGGVAPAGRAVEEGDRALPALAPAWRGSCSRRCRRATGRRRRRAATWRRSRRRRRGTRRSARTAASRRSTAARSRCGQSVGTSQALSRRLHTAASWKRSSRSSLQENQPVRRRSVCTTTPRTSSGVRSSGMALDPHVLEAVRRPPRLEDLARARRRRRPESTWPAGSGSGRNGTAGPEVVGGDVAVGPEPLAVGQRDRRAGGPEVGQPDPAVDVLPEVDDLPVVVEPGHRDRHELLHPAHRRRGRVDQPGEAVLDDRDVVPGRVVEAGCVPAALRAGGGPTARPAIRSAATTCPVLLRQPGPVPTTVTSPSSCTRCSWASSASRSPHWSADRVMPVCPRNQPSARTTPSALRPRSTDAVTSYGLHLQPGVVLGAARGQLGVAGPLAVEERLVDALRGGVQPGRDDRAVDVERRTAAALPGARPSGPSGMTARLDPRGLPVVGPEQARLERRRLRPGALPQVGRARAPATRPAARTRAAARRRAPAGTGRSPPSRCPSRCRW